MKLAFGGLPVYSFKINLIYREMYNNFNQLDGFTQRDDKIFIQRTFRMDK